MVKPMIPIRTKPTRHASVSSLRLYAKRISNAPIIKYAAAKPRLNPTCEEMGTIVKAKASCMMMLAVEPKKAREATNASPFTQVFGRSVFLYQ